MNLDFLGLKYGTDKASNHHNYLGIYETYLSKYKGRDLVLVDAIGGYEFFDRGGESLRMWAAYFPDARIVGIDLYGKTLDVPRNVHLYKCSQDSPTGMAKIFELEGKPDVFIDDFSHVNDLTLKTFDIVFPMLKPGGIYIVEDIEGSWYPDHGFGGTADPMDFTAPTIINKFRGLLNDLNTKFIGGHVASEVGQQIHSIHFYTNTIIVLKK